MTEEQVNWMLAGVLLGFLRRLPLPSRRCAEPERGAVRAVEAYGSPGEGWGHGFRTARPLDTLAARRARLSGSTGYRLVVMPPWSEQAP